MRIAERLAERLKTYLRKLGRVRKISKPYRIITYCPPPPPPPPPENKSYADTGKKTAEIEIKTLPHSAISHEN